MSVVDDFIETIKDRLEELAGVTVIYPTRQGLDAIGDKTIVLEPMDVESLPEFDRIGNPPAVGQMLPVDVTYITIPSEKVSPDAFVKVASANGSAAQNAITSPTNWHTFGGNSIDAMIGPVRFVQPEDDGPGSAKFTVFIKYRVNETDFETLRA